MGRRRWKRRADRGERERAGAGAADAREDRRREWPPADAPGTSGGRTFRNNEGLLPATGANGQPLRFQEWDVNRKKSGQGRDAERIITANDGSAWYTLDHYRTFIQIRGPSHD